MRLTRKLLLAVLVAGLAGGAYYAWRSNETARPEQRYKLHTLASGDLTQSVSANGTLNPVSLISVGTQVSGAVKKLHVDFNDKVEKGQVLLELDDALLQAQLKQSLASGASARAALELAQANEARMKTLFAQEFVSRQELDQALQARKAAEAQLAQASAQQERDRANLAYAVIRSPVAGVVVDRVVDVGQTVAASFQTPTLIKIAQDLTRMQIDSAFAEADIGNIRVDQPVRFNVDAFPNRGFRGKVRQIRLNPTTQQNVVTYNVVVAVDNPEQTLLPGMTAYVNVVVAQRQGVLLLPNAALRFKPAAPAERRGGRDDERQEGRPEGRGEARPEGRGSEAASRGDGKQRRRDTTSGTVHVISNGELKAVNVVLGITDSRHTEIVGGELKAGDQVVIGDAVAGNETPPATSRPPPRTRLF